MRNSLSLIKNLFLIYKEAIHNILKYAECTKVDPKLLRPSDVTLQVPCVDKFRKATGWKPRYPFEQSVDLLLEHWRKKIK
jgi:nucleoside-diphosphate-sugar epimerase